MRYYIVFISLLLTCGFGSINAIEIKGVIDGVKYICPGSDETTLEATTTNEDLPYWTYTYEWVSKDGSTLGTGEKKTINKEYIGETITLKTYRNDAEYRTDNIQIKRLDDLGINNISGGDSPLCKDSSLSLTAEIRSDSISSEVTYTWIKNGKDTAVNNSEFIVTEAGTYSVSIQYGGCTATAPNSKTIATPSIQISGLDKLCGGGNLNLTASGMYEYHWGGPDSYNKQESQVTINQTGKYYVVGKSGSCRDSFPFEIEAKDGLEITIDGITALCPGETETTLTALTTGLDSSLEYQWYNGEEANSDNEIEGKKEKQITISESETGDYVVKVTDTNTGCTGSINTTINKIDNISNIDLDKDYKICAGYDKTLSDRSNLTNLNKYKWFSNGTTIGTTTGTSEKIKLNQEGDYSVVGYTTDGCPSDTFNFHLKVNPNPALLLSSTAPCAGDTVTISAKYDPGLEFKWDNDSYNGGSSNTIQVFQSEKHKAFVRDSNTRCETVATVDVKFLSYPTISISGPKTVCKGGSSILTATTAGSGSPESYRWTDQNGNIIKQKDSTLVVTAAGTYTFHAENIHGCETTQEIIITELESPTLSVTKAPQYLCSGKDSITFSATGADSYEWKFGGQTVGDSNTYKAREAGDYKLQGTNATTGCISYITLNVESKSQVNLTEHQDTICEGNSGYISVTADKDCDFLWEKDSSTNDSLLVSQSGEYKVTATDKEYGCTTEKEISVTIHENPIAKISPDVRDTSICKGKKINLMIGNKNTRNNTYTWEDNTHSSPRNISEAGEYILNVTSEFKCFASDTIQISVDTLPVVRIEAKDSICSGDSITLQASGADTYV